MGDFRARDADRDRYVDVIEAAYVDGQLGDQDRELRVSRALTAETLDELDALTRDLQNRPAPAVRTTVPGSSARPGPGVGKAVGVVAGIAFLGALLTSMQADEQWSGGTSEDHAVAVPWEDLEEAVADPGYSVSPRGVREALAAYRARFGSLGPYEVAFLPRRMVAQVPVPGSGARHEVWSWDGAWTEDAGGSARAVPRARVDLAELDAGRLVDNIRTAKRALRVEQGRLGRAVLSRTADEPAVVTILITNQFNESGVLTTTPSGEILGRQPYTP